jgi:hypothetical protein
MKQYFSNITTGIIILATIGFTACKKMPDSPDGTANIYLTAATSTTYLVPGSTKNYIADKATKKLHVPVYLSRSGLQKQEGYTVNVVADDTTAQKLINKGIVSTEKGMVAPAAVYTIPATFSAGGDQAGVDVVFDANKLEPYLGKQLVLSVRITNPSRYAINEKLSTLNIVVDVDLVLLGAKTDVTAQYIKNAGNPFARADNNTGRRGLLAVWTTSNSVKNFEGGTLGGFDDYGGGAYMGMERYGSPAIPNGKIYQTVTLPAARYVFTAEFESWGINDQAYLTAAEGNTLPDVANIAGALGHTPFATPTLPFTVESEKAVSIGIVANLIQDFQWFRLRSVKLYQYKNIFE